MMSRGYAYVPYSSLESVIEANKKHYYLALRQTQGTIRTESPDWQPWITFFLEALSKQKKKPQLRQSEIGRYWTLQAVSRKHGVPPTNIVRASKGVPGKPKIHSLRMCGGTGVEVYYEPDVKAYAKVYEPIKKRIRSEACHLRTLASRGRAVHWVPVKSEDGGAVCGAVGDWSAPMKSSAGKRVCGRCKTLSGRYYLKKNKSKRG